MLKLRVITAIVMALILFSVLIYLPPVGMSIFFALVVLLAAWEWGNLAGLKSVLGRLSFTLTCAALMVVIVWYCQLFSDQIHWQRVRDILGAGCLWWSVALLWVMSFPGSVVIWGSVFMRILMGLVTLIPAWLALAHLSFHQYSTALILILVALVASADTGAYFVGRAWGKAKLAPKVSPGKSWAGFWGGLVSSCVLAIIFWLWLSIDLALTLVLAMAVMTSLASVLGDLLESMVKRQRGIKDSGTLLPGHGGIMDRLDSLSAASPVFSLCLLLAG